MKERRSTRWLPAVGIALALAMLAGAVLYTRQLLREQLRAQLARRDAALIAGLFQQRLRAASEDVPDDPLLALLETAQLPELPGVLTVTVFDPEGRFVHGVTGLERDTDLPAAVVTAAREGSHYSVFRPAVRLADEFLVAPDPRRDAVEPLLEVVLRLPEDAGFARFLADGSGLVAEFRTLDATLGRQSWLVFLGAGAAMTLALAFVFRQLTLAERRLLTANRELTLAAKTAAVGAVTAHLLHGLKNPLAGLHQFVSTHAGGPELPAGPDWTGAADSTRRMRTMIDDVTRMLREDSGLGRFDVPVRELLQLLERRLSPVAGEREVHLQTRAADGLVDLPNQQANVVLLILENLGTNAIQASPAGATVTVTATVLEGHVTVAVRDGGTGIPDRVQARLFTPVTSTKAGGTGLGLALSRQLALTIGADLLLTSTGPDGTEFRLRIPPDSTPSGP